ncbi:hypothetical protein Tco_0320982 [Tanacetum coccineum]
MTLAVFLLHKDANPSLMVRKKHSPCLSSDNLQALIILSWFWIRILTSSMGSTAVFDTATETHSIRKPIANPNSPFSAGFERRRWIREDPASGKHLEGVVMTAMMIGPPMVVCVIVAWCSGGSIRQYNGGYDGGVVVVMTAV